MKLVEINSYSPEKSFEVKSGALRVTDPCYNMETWCAGTLESVKNGKWLAHVGYNIDPEDVAMMHKFAQQCIDEQQALIDDAKNREEREALEIWYGQTLRKLKEQKAEIDNYTGRVAYIAIRHESTIACSPPYLKNFTESEIHVGVDSGQAGFFDLELFAAQSATESEDGYQQDTEHGKFYRSICEQTGDDSDGFAIVPFGAASSSGYGDGGYPLYVLRDKDGLVIEAIIIFLAEYDEEDEEEGEE